MTATVLYVTQGEQQSFQKLAIVPPILRSSSVLHQDREVVIIEYTHYLFLIFYWHQKLLVSVRSEHSFLKVLERSFYTRISLHQKKKKKTHLEFAQEYKIGKLCLVGKAVRIQFHMLMRLLFLNSFTFCFCQKTIKRMETVGGISLF